MYTHFFIYLVTVFYNTPYPTFPPSPFTLREEIGWWRGRGGAHHFESFKQNLHSYVFLALYSVLVINANGHRIAIVSLLTVYMKTP